MQHSVVLSVSRRQTMVLSRLLSVLLALSRPISPFRHESYVPISLLL